MWTNLLNIYQISELVSHRGVTHIQANSKQSFTIVRLHSLSDSFRPGRPMAMLIRLISVVFWRLMRKDSSCDNKEYLTLLSRVLYIGETYSCIQQRRVEPPCLGCISNSCSMPIRFRGHEVQYMVIMVVKPGQLAKWGNEYQWWFYVYVSSYRAVERQKHITHLHTVVEVEST